MIQVGWFRNLFFGPEFKRTLLEAVLADTRRQVFEEIDAFLASPEEKALAKKAVDLLIKRAVEAPL